MSPFPAKVISLLKHPPYLEKNKNVIYESIKASYYANFFKSNICHDHEVYFSSSLVYVVNTH